MDRDQLRAIVTELATSRSRRHLLATAGRGTIGGVGAALLGRGLLPGGGPTARARAQAVAVSIEDFEFVPPTIEVPVGTEVTWTNHGAAPHTATSVDGTTFDSGTLTPGDVFAHTFAAAGVFDYFCRIHGQGMSGTVTVVAATPTTAPTEPTTAPTTEPTTEPTAVPCDTAYVRRNVHHLNPNGPELTAYAAAVAAMKALPSTDPLSWAYQANMHATWFNPPPPEPAPPTPEPAGWTTCEHGTLYFWPWHRMYLYWFERIIRAMSGDATFALPYWDYSDPTQRALPAPFVDPTSPLFVAERDSGVNSGSAPGANVPESIFDHCAGLAQANFDFASFTLEGTPHGQVHVWVGGAFDNPSMAGWMSAFDTAARDPIFWLHHSNIDRLWESWLALGNVNSADPAWLANDVNSINGRRYDFFDQTGAQVTTVRVVTEVVDAAALGYGYEALADLSMCPEFLTVSPGGDEAAGGTPAATPTGELEFGSSETDGAIEVGPGPAAVPVALDRPEAAAGIAGAGGAVVLTLDGVQGTGVPAVAVEVYINLPAGQEQTPDFRSPYYVGNLNLFGLLSPTDEQQGMQAMMRPLMTQRFDIGRNVAALEASGEWTGDLEVTLVPYYTASAGSSEAAGGTPEAAAPPAGPWVTVESVSVTSQS